MRNASILFCIQLTFCKNNATDSVFDLLVFDPRTKGSGGSVSQINFSWFGPKMSEHVKVAQMKTPSEFDSDRTNMCSFQLFGKSYIIGGYGKGCSIDILYDRTSIIHVEVISKSIYLSYSLFDIVCGSNTTRLWNMK